MHLVPPPQEMPYALINVVTNRPIRRCPGSVAEVRRPAPQDLIQPVPHPLPGPRVARHQKLSHLVLDACHRLLRRTCPQIPTTILLVAMRPERVTQKVEALLTRLLDAGLRLIQGDSHPCYHLPRPIQCLCRFSATENHEIVRVVHDMSVKLLSPFGVPPTLQQTVHVQVGEHRAGNASLRCPAAAILPSRQPTLPVLISLLDWGLQPHLDQTQHIPIDDPTSHTLQKLTMWNGVKVLGQISVDYIGVAFADELVHFPNGVLGASLRSVTIGTRFQIRLEYRLQHDLGCGLHHPVPNRQNPEWSLPASGLWDHHPSHRLWSIRLVA